MCITTHTQHGATLTCARSHHSPLDLKVDTYTELINLTPVLVDTHYQKSEISGVSVVNRLRSRKPQQHDLFAAFSAGVSACGLLTRHIGGGRHLHSVLSADFEWRVPASSCSRAPFDFRCLVSAHRRQHHLIINHDSNHRPSSIFFPPLAPLCLLPLAPLCFLFPRRPICDLLRVSTEPGFHEPEARQWQP